MNKKKILFFTDWYEPGFKAGGPIQSCRNIVSTFAEQYDFWIFTSDRDFGDKQPYIDIQKDTWLVLPNNARIMYASPSTARFSNVRKLISDIAPDIVYLNSMFSQRYSLLPIWVLRSLQYAGRIILAPRGMLNTNAICHKRWKKKIFLSLFSTSVMAKKIIFHATNKQEQNDVKKYFSTNAGTHIVQNIPNIHQKWVPRNKQPGQLNLVYLSRIHPIKNLLYTLSVLKAVGDCSILFDVYGTVEDEKYFEKCKRLAASINNGVQVNFKGAVPHNRIFDLLSNYHLFFLPTTCENFGHVIFEAMSSGCVLLISDRTPWTSLERANAGWSLALERPAAFSEKIKEMCAADQASFNIKSKAAHEHASRQLDSMDLRTKYTSLFEG
jgi:glycosyltransferase involved in cell wall biosynthesis